MTISAVLALALSAGPYLGPGGEGQTWVEEALSWGANQKRVKLPSAKGSYSVRYSTPYLRVAMAAQEAKRQGRNLDAASVPHKLTAPELHLFAWMLALGSGGRLIGMAAATDVTLVVAGEHLKPSGVEALARPMGVGEPGGDMRKFEGRELKAVFPLSQPIPADVQAIVEYSWVENGNPKLTQRTYKIVLSKTKW